MRIMYLAGLESGSAKSRLLATHFGAEAVHVPDMEYTFRGRLNPITLHRAVRRARRLVQESKPDVIVASSLGGWVAAQIVDEQCRLVMIAPAWKKQTQIRIFHRLVTRRIGPVFAAMMKAGAAVVLPNLRGTIPCPTITLHSPDDVIVPIADSRELLTVNNWPSEQLIEVGVDHGMTDAAAIDALIAAVERISTEA